jgi:hypothetical protein
LSISLKPSAQKKNRAELVAAIAALGRAQQDFATLGFHGSARQLHGCRAHTRRDLVEGQAVLAKLRLRNLDADLERADP